MKIKNKKLSYTAPKMEATSFKAEQGYATSVATASTKITMQGKTL